MSEINFDATQVAPSQPFEIIPPGKYKVQIIESDLRPTKDGEGKYLWLEMDILEGDYQGRKLWDRLNLVNNNAQTVEIARRSLSALCHATGKLHVADSSELHFAPVIATVKVKPAQGGYDSSNEIRGYSAVDGSTPTTPSNGSGAPKAPTQAKATATPAAGAATPPASAPWRKNKTA